jgi:hypothetical protein
MTVTIVLAVLIVALIAHDRGALSPATWIGLVLGAAWLAWREHRRT